MVLQFVVNGTPMHYGMLRVCYRPHPGLLDDSDPTFNFAVASNASASTQNYKMVASQFMGAYINPCYDNSIELRIPYASQKPGIELGAWKASTNYADFDRLGTLLTLSFAPLRHANNGNNPVIIEVYGHMENVVVDVPTAIPQGYTLEQAANIVRRTLRAAAKATALANEWTPRVLSAAAMLGFSRPLTHDPPESYRAIPYNLANYDSPDTATPLSLSASAEGTLGGQELGVGGTDELLLSNIAARTCFVCASEWTQQQYMGGFVFGSLVTPILTSVSWYTKAPTSSAPLGYSPVEHVCLTPCAFAALTARYWRCTMSYKFTVVGSPYHKGRLRIYYDPYTEVRALNPNGPINLTNSVILDLATSTSVVVDVPWQNVRDMAARSTPVIAGYSSAPADFDAIVNQVTTNYTNGIIVCEVLSPLTALVDNSPVVVIVEVCAKDLVLFDPDLYALRSSSGLYTPLSTDDAAQPYTPQSYDVTGGDAIASLRQLVKRYTGEYERNVYAPMVTAQGWTGITTALVALRLPIWLPVPGYSMDPNQGLDLTPSGEPINYTSLGFHTYISKAFSLARGSIRWKVVVANSAGSPTGAGGCATSGAAISRYSDRVINRLTFLPGLRINPAASAGSDRGREAALWRRFDRGGQIGDGASNKSGAQATLDVEFPFVSCLRAFNPREGFYYDAAVEESGKRNAEVTFPLTISSGTGSMSAATVDIMTAAGEDFNVYCYTHAPAFLLQIPPAISPSVAQAHAPDDAASVASGDWDVVGATRPAWHH
jgi:hypothetical protein